MTLLRKIRISDTLHRHIQFGNFKSLATLCVLLLMAFLLFNDPFLLLWWPQEPAQGSETGGLPPPARRTPLTTTMVLICSHYDRPVCRLARQQMVSFSNGNRNLSKNAWTRLFVFCRSSTSGARQRGFHNQSDIKLDAAMTFLHQGRMEAVAVWALLLSCGVSTATEQVTAIPATEPVITLDMAPNAVDDMYSGCKDKMKTKVEKEFLPNEKNTNSQFRQAWEEAEQVYNTKWKRETVMAKEQFIAIYAYNFGKRQIYQDIKTAIQTQHCNYKTTFSYHSMTFFLTDALQNLNARGKEKGRCFIAYHRVDQYFSQNVLGKEIRFGYFTSTTLRGYNTKQRKGNKSCFKIETCYGADISMFGNVDTEALIPPYEVFNVTGIKRRCQQPSLECDVVYELKSTHALSNLNCALFPQ